jgi:ABC-2 type transport system ATP-binding protein
MDHPFLEVPQQGCGEVNGPVVDLQNVSKFYKKVLGLNDFTCAFGKGMIGLLGPNGAGKSTMLKLIMGQIKPSKGRISVLGMKPWDNPKLYEELGYCPEQDTFFKGMTGEEFVTFNARLYGHSHSISRKMARKTISMVGMKKDSNRAVEGYSKGMRQRIKLAQALVNDPHLLILDEPLAGTDPIGRVMIMDLLHDLENEGKDVIISSHVLHEIERLTTNIVIVNKGRLIAEGNLHEIRDSMDRFPLTIRIKTHLRNKMAKILFDVPSVTSISFGDDEDELLVRSRSPMVFYPEFQRSVVSNGLDVHSIDSPDDSLDAIFKYLVG